MAYMDQTKKAALAPGIKAVLNKYGMKATLGVRHHSTLCIRISSGKLDVIGNAREMAQQRGDFEASRWENVPSINVNQYWLDSRFSGDVLSFLQELCAAANVGNHDRSDIQSDFFCVGWYVDINVGAWNKPYRLVA